MNFRPNTHLSAVSHSYAELERDLRTHLDQCKPSYREIADQIEVNHARLWAFHRRNAGLPFIIMDKLAGFFSQRYQFVGKYEDFNQAAKSLDALEVKVRAQLSLAVSEGISYRKIGKAVSISHEWVRCFHTKQQKIDLRKMMVIADYLSVSYEISNFDIL